MTYKNKEDIEAARLLLSFPGESLLDTINSREISQAELASRMGRPLKTINEIIQGKAAITPETAIQLERVLSISAEFWMERERNYRLELAEISEAELLLEKKEWLKNFPLAKMKELGWLNFPKNEIVDKFRSLLSFFSVSNIDAYYKHYSIEGKNVAYRMTKNSNKNPYSVNAWLRQGEITASNLNAQEYNANIFKDVLQQIKSLMAEHPDNFFEELQSLCLKAGVKVVYTPCLPNTKLHGSTRWINNTPLIQLSNQYKRNDIFWFTFFHEAGHILKHGKKDVFIEGLDYTDIGEVKEKEADDFAVRYTFSLKDEKKLLEAIKTIENKQLFVNEFAKKINTHPALIIGRLAKDGILHDSLGWTHGFYRRIDLYK